MKRLQIGIDINEANVKNRVGTGQYCYHILKYFSTRPEFDFHLYHRDPILQDLPQESLHWHYHQVGPSRGWISFGLPLYLLTHPKNDVFWSPAHYMPGITMCPSVVTVHDLAYVYFPELFLQSDLYKLTSWTRSAVRQSTKVIAVSRATKNDLAQLYHVDPAKVAVIHNGYDADVFNLSPKISPQLLNNWQLQPNQYILFLGTIQPRKNATKLIAAFDILKAKGYSGKLVLAGGIGWLAEETLKTLKASPNFKDIVLTGYISDEVRKTLYTYCDVYVLPSLYEGFGVPAIEAMGCGAPVAVSNNSSLPEVVGDAAVLFDPHDQNTIVKAIENLKQDRQAWVQKSLARAQEFSWAKCAEQTLDIIVKTAQSI